jgi:hypothetical protein
LLDRRAGDVLRASHSTVWCTSSHIKYDGAEHADIGVFLDEFAVAGMDRDFGRRQRRSAATAHVDVSHCSVAKNCDRRPRWCCR